MATIRYRFGGFDNDQAVLYMEYDDIIMRISAIVCENYTQLPVYAALIRNSDNQIRSEIFQPGITTIPISTQGPTRIDIEDLGRGHWGNITVHMGYPA